MFFRIINYFESVTRQFCGIGQKLSFPSSCKPRHQISIILYSQNSLPKMSRGSSAW